MFIRSIRTLNPILSILYILEIYGAIVLWFLPILTTNIVLIRKKRLKMPIVIFTVITSATIIYLSFAWWEFLNSH